MQISSHVLRLTVKQASLKISGCTTETNVSQFQRLNYQLISPKWRTPGRGSGFPALMATSPKKKKKMHKLKLLKGRQTPTLNLDHKSIAFQLAFFFSRLGVEISKSGSTQLNFLNTNSKCTDKCTRVGMTRGMPSGAGEICFSHFRFFFLFFVFF